MWGFFSLGLVGVGATIAHLLRRYAAPSVPAIVLAMTAYAWAVSMSIVLITPLDVAATLLGEAEPAVSVLWKITYWSTQVCQAGRELWGGAMPCQHSRESAVLSTAASNHHQQRP
jgi:hypothetical protein